MNPLCICNRVRRRGYESLGNRVCRWPGGPRTPRRPVEHPFGPPYPPPGISLAAQGILTVAGGAPHRYPQHPRRSEHVSAYPASLPTCPYRSARCHAAEPARQPARVLTCRAHPKCSHRGKYRGPRRGHVGHAAARRPVLMPAVPEGSSAQGRTEHVAGVRTEPDTPRPSGHAGTCPGDPYRTYVPPAVLPRSGVGVRFGVE